MSLDLVNVRTVLSVLDQADGMLLNKDVVNLLSEILPTAKQVYYYLKILKEIKLIESNHQTLGFCWENDYKCDFEDSYIEITFIGRQVLEALGNNALMTKINNGAQQVNFTRLQNIPALTIQSIFHHMAR